MPADKLRRKIAVEAARLLYGHEEKDYVRAKRRAAVLLGHGAAHANELPTNREIREQIYELLRLDEAHREPRDQTHASQAGEHLPHDHDHDRDLERQSEHDRHRESSIGNGFANRREQELLFEVDRFQLYRSLLLPLEKVIQNPATHPEGDALYHSLQVFELARDELPYDEEFLLAALLHDVGKGIDPRDHIAAGLEALGESITPRTRWLIEHHPEATELREGTLGMRSRRRLQADESYEELMLLADCDRRGRMRGMAVPDVEDALAYIQEIARACDEDE